MSEHTAPATVDPEIADLYDSHAVRVITTDGELTRYTDHGQDYVEAWDDFAKAARGLADGEIAQLIVDDLITAEHNPEYHGPATQELDPADYC